MNDLINACFEFFGGGIIDNQCNKDCPAQEHQRR